MERQAVGTGAGRPVRWSSARWCGYFEANAKALLAIPWEQGVSLTDAERAAVADSVRNFQLGESSEGENLLRAARRYAERSGDERYPEAMGRFIAEEQRHAHDLGRFLTLAGIPLLARSWSDAIFRLLRRLAGLELFITVLVTAEMIGKIYYQALRRATRCPVLRRLCEQLLRDEIKHIRFHSERLAMLNQGRARWKSFLVRGWHRFLYTGTSLVVWWLHRRALRAGGYGFRRFWWEVWQEFRVFRTPIDAHDLPPAVTRRLVPVG